jgi:hypothetical protein
MFEAASPIGWWFKSIQRGKTIINMASRHIYTPMTEYHTRIVTPRKVKRYGAKKLYNKLFETREACQEYIELNYVNCCSDTPRVNDQQPLSTPDPLELLKSCLRSLKRLDCNNYEFSAWLTYSLEEDVWICGVDVMSYGKNTCIRTGAAKSPIDAIIIVNKEIHTWDRAGTINYEYKLLV